MPFMGRKMCIRDSLYFTCVDKDNYMVKKLNISTGDIKDLYVQELQHEKDYGYVHLKNYDGNYIYIYKGVNLMALSGKPLDEQFKKYDNYIYILDTDGNIKDTVILNNTDEKDVYKRQEYEPLYQCAADVAAKQHKKGHFVTCDDYVTMSDGTGIVHIAPAFGEDDAKVGRKYDLPFVQFVDGKGELTKETPYAGLFVKKADLSLIHI